MNINCFQMQFHSLLGSSCITYEPCADEPNSFSLSSRPFSLVDKGCNEDYVVIESSSNSCSDPSITHRYCERVLNSVSLQTVNNRICGNSFLFIYPIFSTVFIQNAIWNFRLHRSIHHINCYKQWTIINANSCSR